MTTAQRVADGAAAVSIPTWVVSVAANSLPVIQWLAGFVAIVAGVVTIAVHIRRWRAKG